MEKQFRFNHLIMLNRSLTDFTLPNLTLPINQETKKEIKEEKKEVKLEEKAEEKLTKAEKKAAASGSASKVMAGTTGKAIIDAAKQEEDLTKAALKEKKNSASAVLPAKTTTTTTTTSTRAAPSSSSKSSSATSSSSSSSSRSGKNNVVLTSDISVEENPTVPEITPEQVTPCTPLTITPLALLLTVLRNNLLYHPQTTFIILHRLGSPLFHITTSHSSLTFILFYFSYLLQASELAWVQQQLALELAPQSKSLDSETNTTPSSSSSQSQSSESMNTASSGSDVAGTSSSLKTSSRWSSSVMGTPRQLAGSPTKSPSSGLHKPTWRPSSKPAEHRMLTEKTASSVSQAAKNAIYGLSGPTKSPSTGLHKPTWKPTPGTPTGKPLEHRRLTTAGAGAGASLGPKAKAFSLDSLVDLVGRKIKPTSAPSRGTPPLTPKNDKDSHTGKPQERTITRASEREEMEPMTPSQQRGESFASSSSSKHPNRLLAGSSSSSTTKPLSALKSSPRGVPVILVPDLLGKKIKPTSAPSRGTPPLTPKSDKDSHTGKPQERKSTDKGASSGPPHPWSSENEVQNKNQELGEESDSKALGNNGLKKGSSIHPSRMLSEKTASSVSQAAKNVIYGLSGPTKSPSTGLHKPTWKPTPGTPTGKPLEHRRLTDEAKKLPKEEEAQQAKAVAKEEAEAAAALAAAVEAAEATDAIMQDKKDAAHVTRSDGLVGTYEKVGIMQCNIFSLPTCPFVFPRPPLPTFTTLILTICFLYLIIFHQVEKEKVVEEEEEEEVGFVVDTSHPSESAANKITTTTTTTTTTTPTATGGAKSAAVMATGGAKSAAVMATIAPDYGHGPMTTSIVASAPMALPSTVTADAWEVYDPLAATTTASISSIKKASASSTWGSTTTATASDAGVIAADSKDIRPFADFTAIVPLNAEDSTATTATATATTKATTTTAAAVTMPVATAIADESTVVGQPPNHKGGEPMYPTVVDMPLSEPDNGNAPSAEKLGNEDLLPEGVATAVAADSTDKASKKKVVVESSSDSSEISTTAIPDYDKAKKGTTFSDHHLTTLPQGMADVIMTSSSGRVSRPTMTPRTVKPAEYHDGDHIKKTHKPTHIEHDHNTRKPTHVEIGKATRKPTHLEGGDALKVVQKVKGVTVAQASESSFQTSFVATIAKELHVPEGSISVSGVTKKGKGKGSVRVTYTIIDVPKNKASSTGKGAESSGLAKALTKTLQDQGYDAADATTAHASRTKNPSFDDDAASDNTDVTAVVATQSFSGVTVVEANELPFKAALVAAVAEKLKVDEDEVTITDIDTSKNGKEVVVEYQITGE